MCKLHLIKYSIRITLATVCGILLGFSTISGIVYAQDQLIIISPHHEGIEKEFASNFEKWYEEKTGRSVKTNWRDLGGTSSNYRYIDSEFKRLPDGIGVDIFFGGGTDSYLRFAENDLLTSYKLPEDKLILIPPSYHGIPVYDSEYRWYGAALSSFGIMYNEKLRQLRRLPVTNTWEDLGDISLIGKIGAADPRESGSAHMMYEIILQTRGWDNGFALLTKIGGNVKNFSAGANVIPRDVAAGQVIYGLAIDFYAYSQIASVGSDTIKYVLPSDGAVVNPDSIAILKGAPNINVAQKFLEFVLSENAQKLWMLRDSDPEGPEWKGGLNRASVLPSLYDKLGDRCVVTNPFALKIIPFPYDANKGSTRWDIVNDLFGVLIIDSHKDLVTAWKAIQKCKDNSKRDAAIQALIEMPLTEEEAMKIAESDWKNPIFRNDKIKEWGQFAKQKFNKAISLTR
ncbi:ABC transporter substrate-binding protein [Candidatus Poribacteria bacterium]|nr:ABC transporter substrate-binding protein [Candidatus Poribacteria bacterium]